MKLNPDIAARCLQLADKVDGLPIPPIESTVSEKQFQAAVVKEARKLGYLCYHTYDSRKSQKGFPDLVLVRADKGVYFIELKTESGKLSSEQSNWLEALQAAGQEAGCFRPSDFGKLMELLK